MKAINILKAVKLRIMRVKTRCRTGIESSAEGQLVSKLGLIYVVHIININTLCHIFIKLLALRLFGLSSVAN